MESNQIMILIAMVIYMAIVIGIGLVYAKKANKSSENYYLGGRSLGPWVTAMSAEASDMSGWLLMGLPGVAYWCGIADAAWTAIGLAIGTYVNWLIVAKRLRKYSTVSGNAITIPEFFSNRYHEKNKIIMTLSAIFILVFFAVYASSCFVTCGKLFSTLFGYSYHSMLIAGAIFVVIYTFLGGFLAVCWTDVIQGVLMFVALIITPTVANSILNGMTHSLRFVSMLYFFICSAKFTLASSLSPALSTSSTSSWFLCLMMQLTALRVFPPSCSVSM